MKNVEPRFLDVSSSAVYVGLTKRTIENWISEGLIPVYRPTGKRLICVRELESFVRSTRTDGNSQHEQLKSIAADAVASVTEKR